MKEEMSTEVPSLATGVLCTILDCPSLRSVLSCAAGISELNHQDLKIF